MPIDAGIQDLSPLLRKIISSSLGMLPMLAGRHPWNRLLARTITDTGELPRLAGISNLNRLLLTNIASRSLSNRLFGTVPSNSLNLMSKYLSVGRPSTTFGNGPAKRLLLTSSSKSSFKFLKLRGSVPQNLLELI